MSHKQLTIVATAFALFLVGFLVWKLKHDVRSVSSMTSSPSKISFESDGVDDEQNVVESESGLVEGFPAVPVPAGLELRQSSKRSVPMHTSGDFYARWMSKDQTVVQLETWYEAELKKLGWVIEEPNDKAAVSEQIIHMSKGNLSGFVGIEEDGDEGVEVVIDLQQNK